MQDETPQNEATPQSENVETTTGDTADERLVRGGAVTDAALVIGPTLPVVAAWGLGKLDAKLDAKNEQKQDAEIILPSGTEE
jgi:hypothetical protein